MIYSIPKNTTTVIIYINFSNYLNNAWKIQHALYENKY